MRGFLIIFLIATLRNTHGRSFDDFANLERMMPIDLIIPQEYSAKYVDMIVPEKTAFKVLYDENLEQVEQFFLADDYLFFPEGVQGCRKPVLMRKLLNKVVATIPYRDIPEYDLYTLQFNGYEIRFPYIQIQNSPLLQAFRKKGVLIEDVNSLVAALVFLSEKTSGPFWKNLNDRILNDDYIAAIVDSKKSELLRKLEKSKTRPIDSNGLIVQHMLYNRIRLDDVNVLLIVLQYLEHRKFKVSEIFDYNNLHKYFQAKNLLAKRRALGDRVALDALIFAHGFDYNTLTAIIEAKIYNEYPHNVEMATIVRKEIDAMSAKTNSSQMASTSENHSADQLTIAKNEGEDHVKRRRDDTRHVEDDYEFEESPSEDLNFRDIVKSVLKKRKYSEENQEDDFIDT